MKCLLPIVFLSVLLISCSENINRLEPFRWESTDPDFDAVTLELEQDFMDYLPVDSLSEKVELLETSLGKLRLRRRQAYTQPLLESPTAVARGI